MFCDASENDAGHEGSERSVATKPLKDLIQGISNGSVV